MTPVLTALYGILANDATLTSQLSAYGTGPAIFLGLAPADTAKPYVVVRAESAVPEDSHASERMVYAVDVFDESGSAARALSIAQRVEVLLDAKRPGFSGQTSLGIWRDFKGLVPEDDPRIQHVHLEFVVRYGREDLLA